jgi:hypothetical protein
LNLTNVEAAIDLFTFEKQSGARTPTTPKNVLLIEPWRGLRRVDLKPERRSIRIDRLSKYTQSGRTNSHACDDLALLSVQLGERSELDELNVSQESTMDEN